MPDAGPEYLRIVIPYGTIKTHVDIGHLLAKALNELLELMEKEGISIGELNGRLLFNSAQHRRFIRSEVEKYGVAHEKIARALFGLNSLGRPRTLADRDNSIWAMRQKGKTFGRIGISIGAKTADVKAAYYREEKRRRDSEARLAKIFEKIKVKLLPFNIHFIKTPR